MPSSSCGFLYSPWPQRLNVAFAASENRCYGRCDTVDLCPQRISYSRASCTATLITSTPTTAPPNSPHTVASYLQLEGDAWRRQALLPRRNRVPMANTGL
ncbi:hypothetical protein K523DRAFT_322891 [Schizophyllum commune Tattone D]|nr:hypothetical protein K523DRAFT_322891 [Schizophyllum commune Tattone D]